MSDGPIVAQREVDTVDVAQPCTHWFVVVTIGHPFEKGGTQPNPLQWLTKDKSAS